MEEGKVVKFCGYEVFFNCWENHTTMARDPNEGDIFEVCREGVE